MRDPFWQRGTEFAIWLDRDRGYAFTTRSTRTQHVRQVDRFIRQRFGRGLMQATTDQIRAFLAATPHPKSRNGYLCDLRSFFEFTRDRGYRKTDPTAGIRRFREPRYLPRPLTREEIRRLRVGARLLGLRHQVIVDLALYAGPRRAEMATLSWSDIDFNLNRLRFKGKGSKEGIVPMHEELASLLRRWQLETIASGDEWVLPSNRGSHLRPASVWRAIKEAGAAAGIDVTPHRLRHSFATYLLEAGSDIRAVQELLRHASLTSTQVYTKVAVQRLEHDVAKLAY